MPASRPDPAPPEVGTPPRFDSPRSIRALAHPARVAVINALATGEEMTATECAELTGLSPSATAYHLKILERFGFAEPAPARSDHRQRPWRSSRRRAQIDVDSSTAAGAAASAAVLTAYFDTTRTLGLEFVAGEPQESPEWRDAALHNADLWLTAAEVPRVAEALQAVLEPYRVRDRLPGSRRVRVMNVVVPHPRRGRKPG
ncbi:MAG: ArsR family transcriptional regulator [Candidatus Dormibacteria bacterium]